MMLRTSAPRALTDYKIMSRPPTRHFRCAAFGGHPSGVENGFRDGLIEPLAAPMSSRPIDSLR